MGTAASSAEGALSDARAFWVVAQRRGELRIERLAPPASGEVLVETLYSGVSRGTERLVFAGGVPVAEYTRMRAPHQAGAFPWPVKYGYSNVGRVRGGSAALLGREVFCLYPHQTAFVVQETDVVPVPDGVPARRAVLAANFETSLNVVWDAGIGAGDRVSVVGAGTVGAGVAYLAARHPGADVELVDIDEQKAALAAALGVSFATPGTARRNADVVVHASGASEGLQTALELAGDEATIVEASWFGETPVTVLLGSAFHARRLRLVSSQVGGIEPSRRARWTFRRRLELALRLLTDPRLDALLSGDTPFASLPAFMVSERAGDASLCHVVSYP